MGKKRTDGDTQAPSNVDGQVQDVIGDLDDEVQEYDRKVESYERTAAGLARKAARFSDNRSDNNEHDFSYTQNREVSWLRFDNRVLDEAFDESVPLFERMKFCEIFESNLDEWFMIRVGGLSDLAALKHQPVDNKSNETPSEQLDVLFEMLPDFLRRQQTAFHGLESQLAGYGLERVVPDDLTDADRNEVSRFFETSLSPIISPMVVDPRHPFPNLRNGMLYVACTLDGPDESGLLGMVEVPPALPRVVELPSSIGTYRYMLIEDVIVSQLEGSFGQYTPVSSAILRVTRNADIDPDGEGVEEEEDYRQHMKKVLKRRQRLQPVRLEVEGRLNNQLLSFVREELGLTPERVFERDMPLDLSYVYGLEGKIPAGWHDKAVFRPFEPQRSPMVNPSRPVRDQVMDHDVLLFYPYESMNPLLDLLHEASADDDCISVRITLYRVAKQSRLCESLIAAAENGRDVTVLMELRARFDEANNIEWAERLENAGCTVIYGSEGFKCHSKICQITYHVGGKIRRITCLGTGNFNEKTARLYSDFMLLTAHEGIGEDGNAFFRNLSLGNLSGTYQHLGVAPAGLKPLIMRGLDREIARARAGQPAKVFFKMNSLTDRDVIDKIAEATQAGVTVLLIVRGICCIRANVPGKTEGLLVHQIVGRLLEHSRVYAFGSQSDLIYLSSADMMTRNTERRVEICFPVLDPACRDLVVQYMNLQLVDNVKARQLTADGTWERIPVPEGMPLVNCQETLIELAYKRARSKGDKSVHLGTIAHLLARIPTDTSSKLLQMGSQVTPHPASSANPSESTDAVEAAHRSRCSNIPEQDSLATGIEAPRSELTRDTDVPSRDDASDHSEPVGQTAHAGRFVAGFSLIGRGLRTLVLGTPKGDDGRKRL